MKFIADAMCGKLARWLRIVGYDVRYDASLDDDDLVEIALEEDRVLLTRDAKMLLRRDLPPHLLIVSDDWKEQLAQVVQHFGLDTVSYRFSRCVDCNEPLIPIGKAEVQYRVPSYIFDAHDTFYTCPQCRKVFWVGSHIERGRKVLDSLFTAEAAGN
ncbi:MAG: Mut7-C RNAse domain-containing protein [Abditibacteriales bacterium]|nr:Mut7-C RNAse domain-containing protein [Abditibacteriales bacterium]MDW8367610.1 Mut7-C RNAse domain-containing protein [Abditibacteriales bacterium]